MKEYAIYKGDQFIDIDTAENLAKKLEVSIETIKFYATKGYYKRFEKSPENRLITVPLD